MTRYKWYGVVQRKVSTFDFFCLELEAKMYGQVGFDFEGDTFLTYLSTYAINIQAIGCQNLAKEHLINFQYFIFQTLHLTKIQFILFVSPLCK